jgi:hypothetical protein
MIFDSKRLHADMNTIREQWGLTWQKVASESKVPLQTIERLEVGGGCSLDSLANLIEFFELYNIKKYVRRYRISDGQTSETTGASSPA